MEIKMFQKTEKKIEKKKLSVDDIPDIILDMRYPDLIALARVFKELTHSVPTTRLQDMEIQDWAMLLHSFAEEYHNSQVRKDNPQIGLLVE